MEKMTKVGDAFLTNSQEEAFLEVFKDQFKDQIEFEFPSCSFENLSQELTVNQQQWKTEPNSIYNDQTSPYLEQKVLMDPVMGHIHQSMMPVPVAPHTPIIGKEEFPGQLNFELKINVENSGKHWVYSEKLQKVFIDIDQVLPLRFQWSPPADGLWVRAAMIYKLDQYRSQPVIRCHNHTAADNITNKGINEKQLKHVIRCTHSTSTYEEYPNGHLSVLTPLGTPEAGVENVPMDFKFMCKNSCVSGMNRRSTELIFTLETEKGQVLGRRKLEVRVCSCPKRDKEKEEMESENSRLRSHGKKRKNTETVDPLPPPGKRIAGTDLKVFKLNFNVLGKENANAILKYAHDVMAGAASRSGYTDQYKPYMDEVLRKTL